MITLRVLCADDWRLWRELRLEALREAPYAFSSTLSDWQGAGDQEHRWRDRLTNVPLNVIASVDGTPAGMVGAAGPDAQRAVELISMWVSPSARGLGVGDALIDAVIKWSIKQDACRVILAVREENEHAIALYQRNGFVDSGAVADAEKNAPRERLMILDVRVTKGQLPYALSG